jgi:acetyl-CoA acetyltransferase
MNGTPSRWKPNAAVVGLGITEMGKIYGRSAADFAAEAVALALDDAGLHKSDIDGLLINGNGNVDMDPRLQMALGFEDLTMLNVMSAAGSTSGAMVQYAALALDAGVVSHVVLLYADAPLQDNVSSAPAPPRHSACNRMDALSGTH